MTFAVTSPLPRALVFLIWFNGRNNPKYIEIWNWRKIESGYHWSIARPTNSFDQLTKPISSPFFPRRKIHSRHRAASPLSTQNHSCCNFDKVFWSLNSHYCHHCRNVDSQSNKPNAPRNRRLMWENFFIYDISHIEIVEWTLFLRIKSMKKCSYSEMMR